MITGSCMCGNVKFQVDIDEKDASSGVGCHCKSCVKQSSNTSNNIQADLSKLKILSGSPRAYADKTALSGKAVHRNFCPDCGTALWSNPDSMPGRTFLKVGALDHADKTSIGVEAFTEYAIPGSTNDKTTKLDKSFQPLKA